MEVSLSPEIEQFIQQKIESGDYASPEQVVDDALRFFQELGRAREARLDELRREIAIGLEQADRAEVEPLNIESIRTKGREILAAKQAPP